MERTIWLSAKLTLTFLILVVFPRSILSEPEFSNFWSPQASTPRNRCLSHLSVVMEQVAPQQCPLNVIYIRVLSGHFSMYSMGAGKFFLFYLPYLVPTHFQESIFQLLAQNQRKIQFINKIQYAMFFFWYSLIWACWGKGKKIYFCIMDENTFSMCLYSVQLLHNKLNPFNYLVSTFILTYTASEEDLQRGVSKTKSKNPDKSIAAPCDILRNLELFLGYHPRAKCCSGSFGCYYRLET
jgi:hypothetical protein